MRAYQLARQLASRHEVTLLSYVDASRASAVARLRTEFPVEVVEREPRSLESKRLRQFLSVGSRHPFAARATHSRAMQQAIDRLCSHGRFDAIHLNSSVLWGYRFPSGIRVILDEHNIEYEVFEQMRKGERSFVRRAFSRLEYIRFRRFERACLRRVDGCSVTSEREQQIVRRHAPATPTAVVPNGVDLDFFRPRRGGGEPATAVFNGVLDYRPNVDAAHWLVDEVWPLVLEGRPQARLSIVGRGDPGELRRFSRPGVDVTGEVDDVRPYLERAAVVVVPIRMGGGTRLKVAEGLALARPMVSTSLGCGGIDVRDAEHLLIADTTEDFAASIARLFDDPSLGARLGAAGRERMERGYSWDLAGARLTDLYTRAVPANEAASEPS
jgi:polysaccharide biosynthesis protein PslH